MKILEDLKAEIASYYDHLIALLPRLALGLLVLFIFLVIARIARKRFTGRLKSRLDDPLLSSFIDNAIQITNIILAIVLFLYIIGQIGIVASIIGAAGVSAIVIGFAFKDIVENFLAGVILAFNRPFRMGDVIESAGIVGTIIEMSLRETQIKSFDGKDIFIPNGQILKNPLYNYTIDGYLRKSYKVGIDYASEIDEAREIIRNTLLQIGGILKGEKSPQVIVSSLDSSVITLEVFYWINTFDKTQNGGEVHSQAQRKIIMALSEAGIGLPGDIIELKNYNKEALGLNTVNIAS